MICELIVAVSLHLGPGDWNGIHPGARCERGTLMAAAFLNSEARVSAGLGVVWRRNGWFAEGGLATGYSGAPVVPYVRAGKEFEHMRLFAAPSLTVDGDPVLVLGAEARF